jgi:hypothetical protein
MFKKFEPYIAAAKTKIEFIIGRGGRLTEEHRDYVILEKDQQVAKVDHWGRVTWTRKVNS